MKKIVSALVSIAVLGIADCAVECRAHGWRTA